MSRAANAKARKSPRASGLATIHIAATALGMIRPGDDEAYRIMLHQVANVRSAKELDPKGIETVIAHLRSCGWKDTRKATPSTGRYQRGTPAALIRWLWTQLARDGLVNDGSDRALRRYIGGHAGISPEVAERDPRHLTNGQATLVIEQLKQWRARKEDAR